MSVLVERFDASPLLGHLASAGAHHTASGARLALATAEVGGRSILIAQADTPCTADAAAVLAESLGMLSITVASAPLTAPVRRLQGVHAVVGPPPAQPAAAALEAAGFALVAVGTHDCTTPLLAADDVPAGVDLAALLLSYLPDPGGTPATYLPLDRPDIEALDAASARNTVATLFALADDMLRVLPGRSDELVLALARVHGASVAVVAPQRLAGAGLGLSAIGRMEMLLRLAGHADLPVVVVGGVQEPAGDSELVAVSLRGIASAVGGLRRPVVVVPDDAEASTLDRLLASSPLAVTIDPTGGLRAAIARWLHLDPA